MSLSMLFSLSAQAWELPPPPPPLPLPALDAPNVYAPVDGVGIYWPHGLIVGQPLVEFEFSHGVPHSGNLLPVQADTIVFCAWSSPSVDCDASVTGYSANEVFLDYAATDPSVDRTPRPGWFSPTGYDFSLTLNLGFNAWREQDVTYVIGACVGSPPPFGQLGWLDANCEFSAPREIQFTGVL